MAGLLIWARYWYPHLCGTKCDQGVEFLCRAWVTFVLLHLIYEQKTCRTIRNVVSFNAALLWYEPSYKVTFWVFSHLPVIQSANAGKCNFCGSNEANCNFIQGSLCPSSVYCLSDSHALLLLASHLNTYVVVTKWFIVGFCHVYENK